MIFKIKTGVKMLRFCKLFGRFCLHCYQDFDVKTKCLFRCSLVCWYYPIKPYLSVEHFRPPSKSHFLAEANNASISSCTCQHDSDWAWWRHQMETFSALLAICVGNSLVTGEFPAQMPVTRSFDVFFDLRLNNPLSKQWWGLWFETPSGLLWRHFNQHKLRAFSTS